MLSLIYGIVHIVNKVKPDGFEFMIIGVLDIILVWIILNTI